jgi:hypothetical protein
VKRTGSLGRPGLPGEPAKTLKRACFAGLSFFVQAKAPLIYRSWWLESWDAKSPRKISRSGINAYTLLRSKDKNSPAEESFSHCPIELFPGTSKLINNSFSRNQTKSRLETSLSMPILSNEHAKALDRRLLGLFESKALEFAKYSEENPQTAGITMIIAGLYKDLAAVVKS